jgi:hypothetical protein
MLSQTLKSLERYGLVSRKAIPTVPAPVAYSITPWPDLSRNGGSSARMGRNPYRQGAKSAEVIRRRRAAARRPRPVKIARVQVARVKVAQENT